MREGSLPRLPPNMFSLLVSRRIALALAPAIGLICLLLTSVVKLQAAPASSGETAATTAFRTRSRI